MVSSRAVRNTGGQLLGLNSAFHMHFSHAVNTPTLTPMDRWTKGHTYTDRQTHMDRWARGHTDTLRQTDRQIDVVFIVPLPPLQQLTPDTVVLALSLRISEVEAGRQICEFKSSLIYTVSSRPARAVWGDLLFSTIIPPITDTDK